MKKGSLWLAAVLLLGACSGQEPDQKRDEKEAVSRVGSAEILAEKLIVPWSIQKQGDIFYISERPGTISVVKNGNSVRQKVTFSKKLSSASEAGFLGFVLHPDFEKNQRAFAYYTYEDGGSQFNRVVEIVKKGEWQEEKVLLDRIPSGQYHHGGRLKIGPDGKLYITTGDAASSPEIAQDKNSLGGKILRMNLDGTIPQDNPFAGSYVFTYGHRNPQGLAWNTYGALFASEHGPSAHDEINLIKPGKNYGWPVITGDESKLGMETPLFQSGKETWAPSGLAAHKNKLYAATLRGNSIREFIPEENKTSVVVSGYGRMRDVLVDDEYLYFISNNTDGRGNPDKNDDKLYRVLLKDL